MDFGRFERDNRIGDMALLHFDYRLTNVRLSDQFAELRRIRVTVSETFEQRDAFAMIFPCQLSFSAGVVYRPHRKPK